MSSQFLNAARWSSPQNFDRAFSDGQSTSVSLNPRSAQSLARRVRYCGIWKRKLLEPVSPPPPNRFPGSGCAASARVLRPSVPSSRPRRERPGPLGHARRERRRPHARCEVRNCGSRAGVQPIQEIRKQHRHDLRDRPIERRRHVLDVGIVDPSRWSPTPPGCSEMPSQHRFHFGRGRIDDRLIDLGVLDHEFADDADAHAFERARASAR